MHAIGHDTISSLNLKQRLLLLFVLVFIFIRLVILPIMALQPMIANATAQIRSQQGGSNEHVSHPLLLARVVKKPQKRITSRSEKLTLKMDSWINAVLLVSPFAHFFKSPIESPIFDFRPKPP